MTFKRQHLNWFWSLIVGLFLFPFAANAQGWETIESDNFEVPSDIIAPSQGGYLSVGTTVMPGTGIVLKLDRIDLEGKRVFSKTYDVIDPNAGIANGYAISEFEVDNSFLVTGPKIGYLNVKANGSIDWQYQVTDLNLPNDNIIVSSSTISTSSAYIVTQGTNNTFTNPSLVKIAVDGTPEWEQTYIKPYHLTPLANVTTSDNGCAILCSYEDGTGAGTAIIRVDENGEELWTRKYLTLVAQPSTFVEDVTGDLLFSENSTTNNRIIRITTQGELIIWKTVTQDILLTAANLMLDSEGNIVFTGHRKENNVSKPTLMKFDANGNEVWTRMHQVQDAATIISTSITKEDRICAIGQYLLDQPNIVATAYTISVDSNGDIYDNFITGNIYSDNNLDCSNNNGDFPLSNWLVKADGPIDFYGISDEAGNFSIPVPIGTYEVTISSPVTFYEACTASYQVVATDQPATFSLDFGLQPDIVCPHLQVEVSVPFLRFCNQQTYYVDYCNYGTEAATDVSVTVMLDELLSYVSASPIEPSAQIGQSFTFEIPGTLEVGDCGQFTFTTELTCEEENVGSTVCVDATISPICDEAISTSTTANLRVEGFCLTDSDSIQFDIINDGDVDLTSNKSFIVIEDNVIMSQGVIMDDIVANGGVISRRYPANEGATLNFLIEQEVLTFPAFLGDPFASATVEGCNGLPSAPYTYDNFNDDDGEVWYAQDCQEIISSFDPNDKQVIPNGIEEEHYILPNTSMEYKVRFQNTGTDTAFLVVIRDTISTHLDLRTFVPGASSHPYTYEILNDGYLKFTFENVLLPDSTTNEPASHGFVKYTIRQHVDLVPGTVIENCAAIYFDFNSPVITNCTWNTIRPIEDWVLVVKDPEPNFEEVLVYPNPFVEFVNFEIVTDKFNHTNKEKRFMLYNSSGQLAHLANFDNTNYQFHKENLPQGIYYYEIHVEGTTISSGKLIMQ